MFLSDPYRSSYGQLWNDSGLRRTSTNKTFSLKICPDLAPNIVSNFRPRLQRSDHGTGDLVRVATTELAIGGGHGGHRHRHIGGGHGGRIVLLIPGGETGDGSHDQRGAQEQRTKYHHFSVLGKYVDVEGRSGHTTDRDFRLC